MISQPSADADLLPNYVVFVSFCKVMGQGCLHGFIFIVSLQCNQKTTKHYINNYN